MNDCPFDFEVEYINSESGDILNYRTSSEVIVDKIVSGIVEAATTKGIPLWKTKLKIIKMKRHYMHCFVTIDKMDKHLFAMKLYYN